MNNLMFDARALRLLDRCRPEQGVLITAVNNYGLPGETLTVERCSVAIAEHDSELVLLDTVRDVPIYAHRRVAAYTHWHALRVTTQGLGPWRCFAVAREDKVWRDLLRWERLHPGARGYAHVCAPSRAA